MSLHCGHNGRMTLDPGDTRPGMETLDATDKIDSYMQRFVDELEKQDQFETIESCASAVVQLAV